METCIHIRLHGDQEQLYGDILWLYMTPDFCSLAKCVPTVLYLWYVNICTNKVRILTKDQT
jgi:hypothetical protein